MTRTAQAEQAQGPRNEQDSPATRLLSSCSSHSQGQVVAYRTNIITLTRP